MDFVEMDKAAFEDLDTVDLQAFLDQEGFEEADSAAANREGSRGDR